MLLDQSLLQAVHAAPLEDAPRLVYADWLLERGDPRGELIALQFARRTGPRPVEESRREAELLARHANDWLGPLAGAIDAAVFERGFVAKARIVAEDPAAASSVGAAEWATVECLAVRHRGVVPPSQSVAARLVERLAGLRSFCVESAAPSAAAWLDVVATAWSRLAWIDLKLPGLALRMRRPAGSEVDPRRRAGLRLHASFGTAWFARAEQASHELFAALGALPTHVPTSVEIVDPRRHRKLTRRELRQLRRLLERFPSLVRVKLPRS